MTSIRKNKFKNIALLLIVSLGINTLLPFQAMAAQTTLENQAFEDNQPTQDTQTNTADQLPLTDTNTQEVRLYLSSV